MHLKIGNGTCVMGCKTVSLLKRWAGRFELV